jgi:hypothetical protein
MRQIVLSSIFIGGAAISLSAQALYREPLWQQLPIEVLPALTAPVQIEEASFFPSGTITATVRGVERQWLTNHRITLRFGSRLDAHSMLSFRVRQTGSPRPLPPFALDVPSQLVFNVVPEDSPPTPTAVTPKTRAMVTIEVITKADGGVVYENAESAQQLWRRVMTP